MTPRAPTAVSLTPGQPAWWLWTPGGGGGAGHRVIPKEPRPAVVLRVMAKTAQIHVLDRGDAATGTTRVRLASLRPR